MCNIPRCAPWEDMWGRPIKPHPKPKLLKEIQVLPVPHVLQDTDERSRNNYTDCDWEPGGPTDPISRTTQQKMLFQLSGFFQIWAAGHFTLPNPEDFGESLLSHHTLTHQCFTWEVGLVSCLLYLCGLNLWVVHCCFTPTWDFEATWCDFNLNVNLMCFPFIFLWCALSREML